MDYIEFKNTFKNRLVFSVRETEKLIPGFNKMNLINWQKKGYIVKLRNSFYCFADAEFTKLDLFFIANKIYGPAYISLESALYYYGMIPEAVFLIQSVSTLKTKLFENSLGSFQYKQLKPGLFFGYSLIQNNKLNIKIAEPEKALLDLLYLKSNIRSAEDFEAMRLNKNSLKETLEFNKLYHYAKEFKSKLILKKADQLKRYSNA